MSVAQIGKGVFHLIYTVTLNPALDYFVDVAAELMETEVNRAQKECFKVGGKGLNVALVLHELGISSTALALLGGFSGAYIQEHMREKAHIRLISIPVSDPNRINIKIRQKSKTICINGNGPYADASCQNAIKDALQSVCAQDYVMINGSFMKPLDSGFIRELAKIIHDRQAKLILDFEGLDQKLIHDTQPYLIKPNAYEFSLLVQEKPNPQRLMKQLKQVCEWGAENVLLSMGEEGAIYAGKEGVYRIKHDAMPLINAVGAGDTMLATFIGKRSEGMNLSTALTWCGASGMAAVSSLDMITLKDIQSFLPKCHVECLCDDITDI